MFKFLENVGEFDQLVEEEVRWMFEDAEEIGSSDVSCCVRNILKNYYDDLDAVSKDEFWIVRNAVNHAINVVLA